MKGGLYLFGGRVDGLYKKRYKLKKGGKEKKIQAITRNQKKKYKL